MSYCHEPTCALATVPRITSRGIDPWGSATPYLYILGEAPGEKEDLQGVPFVGRSGELLHSGLKAIEADYNYIRINNTVRCAPRDEATGKLGRPVKKHVTSCLPSALEDIISANPRVILALGNIPTKNLLGTKAGISSIRGTIQSVVIAGRSIPVVPCYHPAHLLRNRDEQGVIDSSLMELFVRDLELAWKLATRSETSTAPAEPTRNYRMLQTLNEVQEYMDSAVAYIEANPGSYIVADWETTHLKHYRPEAYSLGLGMTYLPFQAVFIPTDHYESPLRGQIQEIAHILQPLAWLPIVNQNIAFDYQWFRGVLGITLGNMIFDPMHAHHCRYTGTRPNDLETMAALYLSESVWSYKLEEVVKERTAAIKSVAGAAAKQARRKKKTKGETEAAFQEDKKQGVILLDQWTAWKRLADAGAGYGVADLATLSYYACTDADTTWRLVPVLRKMLADEGLTDVYNTMYRRSLAAFSEMQFDGIKVNRPKVQSLKDEIPQKEKAIEDDLHETKYVKEVCLAKSKERLNFASPPQVACLLYDSLRLPLCKLRNKKPRCTDGDQLEILIGACKRGKKKTATRILGGIKKWRTLAKNLSSYVRSLEGFMDSAECVHPDWKISGTDTGRMSCKDPPVHSMPRVGGYREQMTSRWRDDGGCILGCDECLPPETRVLKTDLSWVAVGDLHPGDEIVGFPEKLQGVPQVLSRSKVLAAKRIRRPCYEITTDRGVITASATHGFVGRKRGEHGSPRSIREWKMAKDLRKGDLLSFFVAPWERLRSFDAGYLAGVLDGEGCVDVSGRSLGFSQADNELLERALAILNSMGIEGTEHVRWDDIHVVRFSGRDKTLKLMGSLRPPRLMARSSVLWEGRQPWGGRPSKPALVLSVRPVGTRTVVALTTSTKTLISEGFLSHNSQIEVRVFGSLANDPFLIDFYNNHPNADLHRYLASLLFNKPFDEITKEERSIAKTCVFASLYGGGAENLAFRTGMPIAAAQAVYVRFMSMISVEAFTEMKIAELRSLGYVTNPTGRRRIISMGQTSGQWRHAVRQAMNTPIQGTANDIVQTAINDIWPVMKQRGLRSKMVLFHHDAIYWDVYPGELFQLIELAQHFMVTEPMARYSWLKVPLKIGIEFGPTWGEKIEVSSWEKDRLGLDFEAEKGEDSCYARFEQEVTRHFEGPMGQALQLHNIQVTPQRIVSVVTSRPAA